MKEYKLFRTMLTTLLYSWGGDTPTESIWAANELLDWIEKEFNVALKFRFEEDFDASPTHDDIFKMLDETFKSKEVCNEVS